MLNKDIFKSVIKKSLTNKGNLFVISSPTAGGKTTVCEELVKKHPDVIRSVSVTTRLPRKGEKDKKDYYFVSREEFLKLAGKNFFLEWEKVHSNYYGTPRKAVINNLKKGKDVVLTIDVQGGLSVRRKYKDAVLVFLLPPSMAKLLNRIKKRRTESLSEIRLRLKTARNEIKYIPKYDYLVINDKLEKTMTDVFSIITAKKLMISGG